MNNLTVLLKSVRRLVVDIEIRLSVLVLKLYRPKLVALGFSVHSDSYRIYSL